jgi:two-component system alkaline phosphatase synthesis response regulator PhoP
MKTILIIDDDKDTSEILEYVIRELDINAVSMPDVLSLSEVQKIDPDLVLIDHWLHGATGGDLCWKIKNSPATRHIPVVMISAVINISQIAQDSCADASIEKPFDLHEIEKVVNKYLK